MKMDNELEFSPEEKKDIKKFFTATAAFIFLMALPGIITVLIIAYVLFHFIVKAW